MANLRANSIVGVGSTDAGMVFDGVTKIKTQNYFYLQTGNTESRSAGISTEAGVMRFNSDSQKLEYYDGAQWLQVSTFSPLLNGGARGVFGGGGTTPARINVIEFITISSTGNAVDFGDLVEVKSDLAACASSTRGVFSGGFALTPGATRVNTIEFITISSTGNAQDFGDLLATARSNLDSCSNSTRGLIAAGYVTPTGGTNTIEYITISATGNSVDYGDLSGNRYNVGSFSNSTRGLFAGGYTGVAPTSTIGNIIDFVTISTLGNAQDFGDLSQSRANHTGCANPTRGVFIGGITPSYVTTIDFVTISTLGNAIKFGDTSTAYRDSDACASPTRGVFAGAYTSPGARLNIIEYITLNTQGNSVDFGDLSGTRSALSACSNAHGGL